MQLPAEMFLSELYFETLTGCRNENVYFSRLGKAKCDTDTLDNGGSAGLKNTVIVLFRFGAIILSEIYNICAVRTRVGLFL